MATDNNKVTMGSLYQMNQQIFKQMPALSPETLKIEFANIGAWFSAHYTKKYYMLLCKERSDYTLIHLNDFNFTQAIQEIQEVLEERGDILALDYVHGEDVYQCWVRERNNKEAIPYMFVLFEADWMVIDV